MSSGNRYHAAALIRPVLVLFVLTITLPAPQAGGQESGQAADDTWDVTEGEKLFALDVFPVLRDKCFGCHSDAADPLQGGLNLQSRDAMLAGGDEYGDAIIEPGEAEYSALVAMIAREEVGYEMPPKEADRLSDTQVQAFAAWVDAGAPWPDEDRVQQIYERFAEGVTVRTSGGLADDWTQRKYKPEDLWAFQPLHRSFEHYSIDGFIDAKMRDRNVEPAPPADRRTLIRRVTFDLIGLPPSPREVDAFINDPADDDTALATLVNRLLESPHYGEQWGRHWLDVTRYADSSGFANDWERPNAWRFRDYVIRSFNDDKPYDQFVIEQLAGDEWADQLKQAGDLDEQRQAELLVAAGFLRMGPWEHTAMSVAKVTRQQYLDDVTDSVGQVFLAQPLQCCRCHDHKFDPIPTRDYYSIQATFATTQFAERKTAWIDEENRDGMSHDRRYHQQRREHNAQNLAEISKIKRRREAEWLADKGIPYPSMNAAKKAGVVDEDLLNQPFLTPEELGEERICRKWKMRFDWEMDRYEPYAFTVYSGTRGPGNQMNSRFKMPANAMKGPPPNSHILTGGDPFADGPAVSPGVLSALPGVVDETGTVVRQMPSSVKGRRLALARWIVDADNPLTPRVIVNRIWSYHFGRGIAGNPNNFGATGKKPTHPKLLNWLAVQFRDQGWSIKSLHRMIINSKAYRRSASHPSVALLAEADPNDELYARFLPRRLAAEEIRDAMLHVSGEWNPAVGGIPIRPDMNLEASLQPRMIMGTFAPSYVADPLPERRNRRSVYVHRTRGQRMPMMETFNQPGSETSCELRDQSNVTPQAFTLINSEETNDRALALADRVCRDVESDDRRAVIRRLFELTLQRPPSDEETEWSIAHWDRMIPWHQKTTVGRANRPEKVVREAIDENTGKPFQFTERLFAHDDYVPDLLPADVAADVRALADVALMILNTNEFMYVY
ncbi:DUF1549 domain-containing protein [Crateriforma conspicua]|uniref:Planctomycete cytochrome C n=1 Tax=Crateriforma conspicua TaxID=2527996 RepID=A0A5C6FLB5_9PLAN|nr:DUF1549 domain-containing protein [Crateriforma conspicua]TWU62930.1 Planctomycete cytochrome C [Crateriforma conspicua]